MCSLVTRSFSRDLKKTEIDLFKYKQCFNLINNYLNVYSIYSHSAWFLDGRTSILV